MSNPGFCPEGLDLLIENRMRNDHAFYEENKQQIRKLAIEPFYALADRMREEMLLIDPLFVTVPSRMVSRVRRDTRYTKDKTLYRANLWMFFRRPRAPRESVPFYYFEVGPEYWGYGCWGGFGKGEMEIAREMMLSGDRLFLDARQALEKTPRMSLAGELYKRPKHPDAPEELQDWLNRKELGADWIERESYEALFSGSFIEPMMEDFRRLEPFYRFLCALRERANPAGKENIQ